MAKEELIKKITVFLDESPFDDEEIEMWKGGLNKLSETELHVLFDLLGKKLKIIDEANQLFVDMAEEVAKEENKERVKIPEKFSIFDMRINDLAELIKNNLAKIIKNKDINFISRLDEYFDSAKFLGEDIVGEFDLLIKAIMENQEKLFSQNSEVNKLSISEWLNKYNRFNNSQDRKSIDRINFSNQDGEAKKLTKEERNLLLRLAKLYDYLLHPENVQAREDVGEALTKARQVSGPPKTESEKNKEKIEKESREYEAGSIERKALKEEAGREKEIEDLEYLAKKYPEGSLERRAIEEEIGRLEARS